MIASKKKKLIAALKSLKESQVSKDYQYFAYGSKKEETYCFNGWMYHSLFPKTSFKILEMTQGGFQINKTITEPLLMATNGLHYHYIHNTINFKTAIKLVIQEINST